MTGSAPRPSTTQVSVKQVSDDQAAVEAHRLTSCMPVIPKLDPTNARAEPQEQVPQRKAKDTIPFGDASEAAPDLLSLKLDDGERAMTRH